MRIIFLSLFESKQNAMKIIYSLLSKDAHLVQIIQLGRAGVLGRKWAEPTMSRRSL